jgi:hypothetical protein
MGSAHPVLVLAVLAGCWDTPAPAPVRRPDFTVDDCFAFVVTGVPNPAVDAAFEAQQWSDVLAAQPALARGAAHMRTNFRIAWAMWRLGNPVGAGRQAGAALDTGFARYKVPTIVARADDSTEQLACFIALLVAEPTITPEEAHTFMLSVAGEAYARGLMPMLARSYLRMGRTLASDQATVFIPIPARRRPRLPR